jgi:hypothetical protein
MEFVPFLFPWPWGFPYSPGAQYEIEPSGIYAGATLRFCKLFEQFPSGFWTLQYGLVPFSGKLSGPILFTSTQMNGSEWHLVDVPADVTKAWVPGKYRWQCYAQANSQNPYPNARHFVSTGIINVFANLYDSAAVDTRGKWQRILAEIEALLEKIATDPVEEVSIGRGTIAGQTLKGWDREKLIAFHDYALHMAGNETRIQNIRGGAPNTRYKWAVMMGDGNGVAFNGFPDFPPFS